MEVPNRIPDVPANVQVVPKVAPRQPSHPAGKEQTPRGAWWDGTDLSAALIRVNSVVANGQSRAPEEALL
jgi:hypothetical protein